MIKKENLMINLTGSPVLAYTVRHKGKKHQIFKKAAVDNAVELIIRREDNVEKSKTYTESDLITDYDVTADLLKLFEPDSKIKKEAKEQKLEDDQ